RHVGVDPVHAGAGDERGGVALAQSGGEQAGGLLFDASAELAPRDVDTFVVGVAVAPGDGVGGGGGAARDHRADACGGIVQAFAVDGLVGGGGVPVDAPFVAGAGAGLGQADGAHGRRRAQIVLWIAHSVPFSRVFGGGGAVPSRAGDVNHCSTDVMRR